MEKGVRPKRYRIEFIQPGIISYEDSGAGIVLVERDALDKMRPTFIGCPLFNEQHVDNAEANAENAFDYAKMSKEDTDKLAVGVVADVGTLSSGWDYADCLIWDQDTQKNIDEKGFSASCAYIPTETTAEGGMYHNIQYDQEVLDGTYTHMAIVSNPRYEGAKVYENSKGEKLDMNAIKLFFKKSAKPQRVNAVTPPPPKPEDKKPEGEGESKEETVNAEETYVNLGGNKVPLSEMIQSYMQKKNAEADGEEAGELAPEDEVELPDGSKCTVGDLIRAYSGKENEGVGEPVDASGTGDVVDEAKQKTNSSKKPNEHFNTVRRVATSEGAEFQPNFRTRAERLNTGATKYGPKVKAGKGGSE